MVYYFCGHRGSGKNFFANQIANSIPIQIVDTGPIIRNVYKKYNKKNQTFKEWLEYNESKHGADFTNKVICRATKFSPDRDYIIIGYRSLHGIKYFCDFFKIRNFKIIFIDGNYELFRDNYNARENMQISREEYQRIVDIENSMGIQELRDFAKKDKKIAEYYYKLENNDIIYNDLIKDMSKSLDERER